MSGSPVVDVVVGLSFLFFVLSLVCSGANELIAATLQLRARTLRSGVEHLLDGKEQANAVYEHPVVRSLYGKRPPSYIPSGKFALAFLDHNVPAAVGTGEPQQVPEQLSALAPGRLRQTLEVLWREASGDVAAFRRSVEGWFNDTMERVSGWYRRRTQLILMVIALAVAVGLNVNALVVTQRLFSDAPLRRAVAEQARQVEGQPDRPEGYSEAVKQIQDSIGRLERLSLPIGWAPNARPGAWYVGVVGWLLTAVALSLGAPFWFDLLNRAARLRSTGTRQPLPSEDQEGRRAR